MANAFRCANNDDTFTIKFEEEWFDIVTFMFESPEDGEMMYFVFDFVGVNGVPLEIPESTGSEYQAIVRMPSAKFMRICNKLSSFGDSGDRDTTDALPDDRGLIEMKEMVSLTFDLRCMNSFSKASVLSDQVTISLSSELPAVFEYKIAEMGYIRYYMLPRMAKEEMQNEGDEMQRIAKEDKMQIEGDEMQRIAKEDKM
ncbi:hypothetical protein U9M48_038975 [Paspalum notatum var. saurae]|uniref:Proliferating cell nuclear antigen PCNA C-terminal domain-containing protein n=1 Tax=Paspalum notatum var. saurae TaxID=547442 RepID=A0AAQ3UMP0_PASNO